MTSTIFFISSYIAMTV